MKVQLDWRLLLSVGVVLLGIGALLGGYSLFKIFNEERYSIDKFWVSCFDYYIEINAKADLKNVRVWFDNTTVCTMNEIPEGISKVCDVTKYKDKTKTFVVSTENYGDKIVRCWDYDYDVNIIRLDSNLTSS